MNIDIKKLKTVKEELEKLGDDEVTFITEDGNEKYAVLPINLYETIEDIVSIAKAEPDTSNIKIVNANNFELSYDEYETVKKQIMDAFDKTFKPKPEKLN